jgi:hypothetical protein
MLSHLLRLWSKSYISPSSPPSLLFLILTVSDFPAFSSIHHEWPANLTFSTKTHVIHIKYDARDRISSNSCQISKSWPNIMSVMSFMSFMSFMPFMSITTFLTKPYVIHVKFDILDQISFHSSQERLSWPNLMSFMSNAPFLIRPQVINVKFDVLDHISCHSCDIWRSWKYLMLFMWYLTHTTFCNHLMTHFISLHTLSNFLDISINGIDSLADFAC